MILDERTHATHPAHVREHPAVHVAVVMAPRVGHLVGGFTTGCGVVNEVVPMWRFAGMGGRERRRAAMDADPGWQAFRARTSPFVRSRCSRILRPADFSPMR